MSLSLSLSSTCLDQSWESTAETAMQYFEELINIHLIMINLLVLELNVQWELHKTRI